MRFCPPQYPRSFTPLNPSPSLFLFFPFPPSPHFSLIFLLLLPLRLFVLSFFSFYLSFLTLPLFCFWFFLLFLSFFSNLSTFFVCVRARVCVSRMYVRAYLAIPCVSADDNVKHTKSNIRYDNKINKMNHCELYKNSCI